jgi:hypothetical protein
MMLIRLIIFEKLNLLPLDKILNKDGEPFSRCLLLVYLRYIIWNDGEEGSKAKLVFWVWG